MIAPSIEIKESSPRFSNMLAALTNQQRAKAETRAVNRAGDMARTAMRKPLQQQTGLKARTVTKALRTKRATYGLAVYTITVRGGDIRLKHFAARETRQGVSANPFGKRQRFAGTFIKGGRFPNRVDIGKGGQVFQRVGKGRTPLRVVRSGVVLPEQVVRGETIRAFETVGRAALGQRMSHELNRLLAGAR